MDMTILAPCNYYCGNCIIYKKKKCLGCAEETERGRAEGKVFCEIYICAKKHKLTTCSDCNDYPCKKYDKGIFAQSFIKWIREKLAEP